MVGVAQRTRQRGSIAILVSLILFLSFGPFSTQSHGAPPGQSKTGSTPKTEAINDANVTGSLKRAEELVKAGEIEKPLATLLAIHDFAEDVVQILTAFRANYEKALNDAAVKQEDKEEIYIKIQRIERLAEKYGPIREASTYQVGYLYAKKGDPDKARRFLSEALKIAPFSMKKDSTCMKAKTLLLRVYGLEGEF
jgi:hypothetical protein